MHIPHELLSHVSPLSTPDGNAGELRAAALLLVEQAGLPRDDDECGAGTPRVHVHLGRVPVLHLRLNLSLGWRLGPVLTLA